MAEKVTQFLRRELGKFAPSQSAERGCLDGGTLVLISYIKGKNFATGFAGLKNSQA